ncbi:MAG TPA: glycoside hydrolase domain-containing protein [Actinomycetes bacterium]|nr:glycoside hydrolase domain-containing protein [Actinomycetes bacterium]
MALAVALSAGGLLLITGSGASAEPATPVSYPAGATATRYTGLAFDTCTAPSSTTMRAWLDSPYRALGVYIGGINRGCDQPRLTASWVASVTKMRWRLIPIYMGRQAPCTTRPNSTHITPSLARSQGESAATDAASKAKALGMIPGSAIYADMEHYDPNNSSCRTTVLRFLSGWTKELHRRGYLAGTYVHLNSGAKHLAAVYTSTTYARPDAIWIARWDLSSSLSGWSGVSNSRWAEHQRAKQYRGDHNERHGGVTLNIDNDRFDAPVASVAYAYHVTGTARLSARTAPSSSAGVVRTYAPGATVKVVCQTSGTKVVSTSVWNKLSDGSYVTDRYVSTPSAAGYSAPVPRCVYPYQVRSTDSLNARSGPGSSYAIKDKLTPGSLAWVVCQRSGAKVGTTSIWDRLSNGYWVSDYWVATPSNRTYSKPIRRC